MPNPVRAILFDFDGTISTLRCGWEPVMADLMRGLLNDPAMDAAIDDYISESTGIQTIHQMKWLSEQLKYKSPDQPAPDPWALKDEYNRHLMRMVSERTHALQSGALNPDDCLVPGARDMLQTLYSLGVKLYVASGTDDADVKREAQLLRLKDFFTRIEGAPPRSESCSKEKVIADLMRKEHLAGDAFAVVGDGKVEIALGHQAGARTLGIASDEINRQGINPQKAARLKQAGADLVLGDFTQTIQILTCLGLHTP